MKGLPKKNCENRSFTASTVGVNSLMLIKEESCVNMLCIWNKLYIYSLFKSDLKRIIWVKKCNIALDYGKYPVLSYI